MYCPRPIVLIWQKNQFIGGQEAVYTTQVDNSGSDYQAQWHFHFLSPIVLRGLPSKYKVFLQKQELHPLPPCQATSAWIFNTFQCVKLFASWRHGSSFNTFLSMSGTFCFLTPSPSYWEWSQIVDILTSSTDEAVLPGVVEDLWARQLLNRLLLQSAPHKSQSLL